MDDPTVGRLQRENNIVSILDKIQDEDYIVASYDLYLFMDFYNRKLNLGKKLNFLCELPDYDYYKYSEYAKKHFVVDYLSIIENEISTVEDYLNSKNIEYSVIVIPDNIKILKVVVK